MSDAEPGKLELKRTYIVFPDPRSHGPDARLVAESVPAHRGLEFLARQEEVMRSCAISVRRARTGLVGGGGDELLDGLRLLPAVGGFRIATTVEDAAAMARLGGVQVVDSEAHRFAVPESSFVPADAGDPQVADPQSAWHRAAVGVKDNERGDGVWIGIADTGIDLAHPEFDQFRTHPERFRYAEFGVNGEQTLGAPPVDNSGHGTHVAGLAVGSSVGIAPGANLAVARVMSDLVNPAAPLIEGLAWLASIPVDIVILSLVSVDEQGKAQVSDALEIPMSTLRSAGIFAYAAVGNSGPGTIGSPASYKDVVGIGAAYQNWAPWQGNSGTIDPVKPQFLAPGIGIRSAGLHGRYQLRSGTSMATPIAAGVAAVTLRREGTDSEPLEIHCYQPPCVRL
jgi:subtilisin family serine protease